MRRQRKTQPVGEILVSYEAKAMPTETFSRLVEDAIEDLRTGQTEAEPTAHLLGWLCRIAVHKLRALETA
jgi:hypothetical protein